MAESARFWNWIAKRYARSPVSDEASYQKKLEITQSYLKPDWKVLELGCGTGTTAVFHAPKVAHIRAVDISEKMLDLARQRARDAGVDNIDFEQAAIGDMPWVEEAYDAVLCLSILHLLQNRDGAIRNIFKTLKPGGLFVSSTVCVGDTSSLFAPVLWLGNKVGVLPLVKVFGREDLEAAMTGAGFAIIEDFQPGPGKAVFLVARKPG